MVKERKKKMTDVREDGKGGQNRGRKRGGHNASLFGWKGYGGGSPGGLSLTAHTLSSTIRFGCSVTIPKYSTDPRNLLTYLPRFSRIQLRVPSSLLSLMRLN